MKCKKCPSKAVIDLTRHNAAFCKTCFTEFVHSQVIRAIRSQDMFTIKDSILVAVSGGKDSLVLWAILLKLGFQADALYVNLGIGTYSQTSYSKVQKFQQQVASSYDRTLHIHEVEEDAGAGVGDLSNLLHRPACSACGTIKRYQFNKTAVDHEYDVMATGHNLDDEAARLLGNVLHWQEDYLEKQSPTLPASFEGFAKKVKPLFRLTEREIAAYAVLHGIDYIVEECPMAKGAKTILYKEVLNTLETASPGTKQSFYWKFLDRQSKRHSEGLSVSEQDQARLHPCTHCGQPTTTEICTYCKMMTRAKAALAK